MNRQYPCLEVHLDRLTHNAQEILSRCRAQNIQVCGIIKGCGGMPQVAQVMRQNGAAQIGTSRLEQVARCRAAGVDGPFLLIRIPGLTELPDTVALCDLSLQSDRTTLDALEQECRRQNKTHGVIVMADLGDLREGFWDKDEFVDACVHVERDLPHVHLSGIGVNLSCYGSIQPTPEKMGQLTALALRVEEAIGRKARRFMQVDYAYQTFDNLPEGLTAPEGREKPLGTAHAVWCAKKLTEGCPIAVINADDFYGADAFRKMYDYLSKAEDDDKFRYCMVGYQVENTLTENGTVSRGVCTEDENGLLAHIIERTSIHRDADGVIRYDADGDAPAGEIALGTPVSLNLWGFTPSFLPSLDDGLREFFAEKLPQNPMKGEYYLPFAVDALIKADKATAKVLKTSARWYGVTYREDKPVICEAVAKMTENGEYPAEL